jgi:hypothetical protein
MSSLGRFVIRLNEDLLRDFKARRAEIFGNARSGVAASAFFVETDIYPTKISRRVSYPSGAEPAACPDKDSRGMANSALTRANAGWGFFIFRPGAYRRRYAYRFFRQLVVVVGQAQHYCCRFSVLHHVG